MDWNSLIGELKNGIDIASQLERRLGHLHPEFPLVQSIINSMEKSMSIAISSESYGQYQSGASESPISGQSGQVLREVKSREKTKKRKVLSKWTTEIQVAPGPLLNCPIEDGHSWRKYGQKEILNAKYPRAYFRCKHQITEGCLALKQVQRSADNPSIFNVTYCGEHTCKTASAIPIAENSMLADDKQYLDDITCGLRHNTEDLGQQMNATTVDIPSNDNVFWLENNGFHGNLSECSYFQMSPFDLGKSFLPGVLDSDLFEIYSAGTSTASSPLADQKPQLETSEFQQDFNLSNK